VGHPSYSFGLCYDTHSAGTAEALPFVRKPFSNPLAAA
jgi:hypothetical protein